MTSKMGTLMSHGTNIKENKTTQYRPIPPSCFTSHIVLPSKKEKQKKPLLQKEDGRWFGTTRGSVAQAAAKNKLAKKKHTGVHQDFYRFQEREAQRNVCIFPLPSREGPNYVHSQTNNL
ncbi:hypothetical protein MtrunA17_Chr8g0378711 [Medicago truncatula]|uniref:Ribosomal RNA-processing protein 7 C-terminal domain-containing protein n=1 Tax=Medicago truncatula TaxID=3880 RepID=A0A396GQH6_MEDTR|nr:hypothetical protein MtrunA17_Chr8g0378711 [Medicago truncatula]